MAIGQRLVKGLLAGLLLIVSSSSGLLAGQILLKDTLYIGDVLYCLDTDGPEEIKELAELGKSGVFYPLNSFGEPTERCFSRYTRFLIQGYASSKYSKTIPSTRGGRPNGYRLIAFFDGVVEHDGEPRQALLLVDPSLVIKGLKK